MSIIANRRIERDALLRDGTPGREKGFRPWVEVLGPDQNAFGLPMLRIHKGPLFETKDAASSWVPDVSRGVGS